MSGISTHVLDLSLGRAAVGIAVRLDNPSGNQWVGVTDADGRCRDLLSPATLQAGDYRLTFSTGTYFAGLQVSTIYPEIVIAFRVHDASKHYHIPLLLAPNGYTTYRGT